MQTARNEMDYISKEVIGELANLSASPTLSLYMHTHRMGGETEQNPIRFKNQLSKLEEQLQADNTDAAQIDELLQPLHALLDDRNFWQHQSDGLALFRTSDRFDTFRLPLSFEERAVVSDRPYIKPLLPLMMSNGHFYLLALSQNNVRLFEGTRFQVGEVALPDEIPTSLDEAMRFDDFESHEQFHTSTGARSSGGRAAVYHGHSDAGDEAVIKENIKRFLNSVDKGVQSRAGDPNPPLVLAGVEMMQGLFKEMSEYQNIVGEGINGNPDEMEAKQLHKAAWPIIKPQFAESQEEAIDVYMHLAGNGDERAGSVLQDVVSGAYFQRVDTLFVPTDKQMWGTFDADKSQVELHTERKAGDIELLDFAAAHTLTNGGNVFALEADAIPGSKDVAAVFRY